MTDEFTIAALYGIKAFNKWTKGKVGMMKLIELLNEYSELRLERLTEEEGQPIRKRHDYELEYPIEKIRVISKQYGFIKWLVENEKIDLEKMEEKSEYTFLKNGGGEHIIEDVLMLLSIQDEPIKFLISILK